jgi:uncharacterized protein
MNFADNRLKVVKHVTVLLVILISISAMSYGIDFTKYDFTLPALFANSFIGIFLQAFPFLMAGALLSSILSVFVSRDKMLKHFSSSPLKSSMIALVAAVVIPVCDCASVVVAASFYRKKIPAYPVVIYMLASPILNPVVIGSTFYAFPETPSILVFRALCGIAVSLITGYVVWRVFDRKNRDIGSGVIADESSSHCSCGQSSCSHDSSHEKSLAGKLAEILIHTGEEFVHVLPFVVMGISVSSLAQAVVSAKLVSFSGLNPFIQVFIMTGASFLLSVCSTSDAFIARGFASGFGAGSIVSFLVAGPMIDVKNLITMMSYFNKRFIVVVSVSIWMFSVIAGLLLSFFFYGGR